MEPMYVSFIIITIFKYILTLMLKKPNISENFMDWRNKTALHILCDFEDDPPGALELADMLIRHGASMDSKCCESM